MQSISRARGRIICSEILTNKPLCGELCILDDMVVDDMMIDYLMVDNLWRLTRWGEAQDSTLAATLTVTMSGDFFI